MSEEGTPMNAASTPQGIAVANAPVSYGAFELTVGRDPNVPDGLRVLDQVAGAGYAGIDLGPVGYLGTGEEMADRLAERGLGLSGAYLELPYAEPAVSGLAGRRATRPTGWTPKAGGDSARASPARLPAAAIAATSRRSTRRPAPMSKHLGRSSGCLDCLTSGSALRPAT